ncbi:hypothetical protein DFH09DRAFT_1470947 [Mycena vulgaris]|nr:hypothetical protein DFH09DRAFT_1470947 [Mycena vulgaris]
MVTLGLNYRSSRIFNSVIRDIWIPDFDEQYRFTDETEQSWALALTALAKAWANLDSANVQRYKCLACCTVSLGLRDRYFHWGTGFRSAVGREISPHCRVIFSSQLSKALMDAASRAEERDLETRARDFTTYVGFRYSLQRQAHSGTSCRIFRSFGAQNCRARQRGGGTWRLDEALPKLDRAEDVLPGGVGRFGGIVERS